jgi:hypothetical protein
MLDIGEIPGDLGGWGVIFRLNGLSDPMIEDESAGLAHDRLPL